MICLSLCIHLHDPCFWYSQDSLATNIPAMSLKIGSQPYKVAVAYDTCHRPDRSLYTQRHDGVDYIVPVILQSFDGFLPRDTSLSHDKFDVLLLQA